MCWATKIIKMYRNHHISAKNIVKIYIVEHVNKCVKLSNNWKIHFKMMCGDDGETCDHSISKILTTALDVSHYKGNRMCPVQYITWEEALPNKLSSYEQSFPWFFYPVSTACWPPVCMAVQCLSGACHFFALASCHVFLAQPHICLQSAGGSHIPAQPCITVCHHGLHHSQRHVVLHSFMCI